MPRAPIIPERLDERIHASKMGYTAVARELGVQQPTISRLVKGEQRSTARIDRLAKIIKTTPAYLTGEIDDPHMDATEGPALTAGEAAWVEVYRALDERGRSALMHVAQTMLTGTLPSAVNVQRTSYRGEGEK